MNANELADLMIQFDSSQVWEHAEEIATMLRQQQAEIDSLKKLIAENNALDKKLYESIKKSNEMWDKATKSLLKKAKSES